MQETVYLVDGTSQVYRAFYAIRGLATKGGFPTNATYGFTQMLLKLYGDHDPKYLGMAFDTKGEVFRDKMYDQYKANRAPMPDDLVKQLPHIRRIVQGFSIPILEQQGFEADDVIGTLARKAAEAGHPVSIVTRDKDLMQLVDDRITIHDPMSNQTYRREEVIGKLGVAPEQIPDYLGLAGDSVDNIPGVPGIGPKTAVKLLKEYGTLDRLLNEADALPEGSVKTKLKDHSDLAKTSRDLAVIRTDLDLGVEIKDLGRKSWSKDELRRLFQELEFRKLLEQVENSSHGLFQ